MGISFSDLLSMAPQLIVVTGGLVVLILQVLMRKDGRVRMTGSLAVVTLVAALIVVIAGLSDSTGRQTLLPRAFLGVDTVSALNGSFRYSTFSGNALVLILGLALGILILMRVLTPRLKLDFAENHFLLLMAVAGYAYALCAEDLMTLFVGLELGTLPVMVLVGINRESRAANEAAVKYLLLSAFAAAFFLLGIALLYAGNSTMRLRDLREIAPHFTKTRVVILAYLFILVGFLFKLGAVPMHSYIADVYEGCTTIFTTLLASLSKVAALLVFFKVAMAVHDGYRQYLAPMLTAAAVASMLFGAFASIGTYKIKRILAYSSISHAGYMLVFFIVPATIDAGAMGTLKQDAGSALYIYAVGYGCASLLAFGAIAFLEFQGENPQVLTLENIRRFSGQGWLLNAAIAVAILSFMGMPPFAGFFGKFFLFKYLALSGNLPLAAAVGLASGISVFAYLRVLRALFFGEQAAVSPNADASRYGVRLVFGALLVAVTFFAAAIGFLYNTGVQSIHRIY